MHAILLVGAGGAIGAVLRYAVSGVTCRIWGASFPWGTLVVNVLGCLLIGLAWALAEETSVSPAARIFFLTGILGAFTTFSTFGLETINLIRDGEIALGMANVMASNLSGLLAVILGFFAARLLFMSGGVG